MKKGLYQLWIQALFFIQIFVDEEGKAAVQKIFELYNQGHGYKSISHYMTEHGYPTGRALMVKQIDEILHFIVSGEVSLLDFDQ